MKRSKFSTEQILAIGARVPPAGGGRCLPDARHHRADVLPLKGQVRRPLA